MKVRKIIHDASRTGSFIIPKTHKIDICFLSRFFYFLDILRSSRKVALFGTCGMGGSREYFDQVAHRVEALIPDDNEYLGAFLCCGKMPGQVLERYKMMQEMEDSPRIRKMIQVYEEGMLHPDEADLDRAARFTREVLEKLQKAQTDERD